MSEDEGRVEVGVGGVLVSHKVRSVGESTVRVRAGDHFLMRLSLIIRKRTACSGTSPKAFTLLVPTYTIEDA